MIELILTTVGVALSVPGIVLAIRALPPVAVLVERGVKPWACDVCSCFWITGALAVCTAFVLAVARWDLMQLLYVLVAPPAYTLAMIVLAKMQQPTALPPPPEM